MDLVSKTQQSGLGLLAHDACFRYLFQNNLIQSTDSTSVSIWSICKVVNTKRMLQEHSTELRKVT